MPAVESAFEVYFRRALRGLRTEMPGNLVYNPDFSLETLKAGQPDRWAKSGGDGWVGTTIALRPGKRYHVGAVFRQEGSAVEFSAPPGKRAGEQSDPLQRIVLTPREGNSAEAVFEARPGYPQLTVKILTTDVPGKAVERVWVREAD